MDSDDERVRLARSFDAVAEDYAAIRPHYPAALFEDLAALATPPPAEVVEIGCGPGTATGDLLGRGWRVLAVEPGEHMADIARRRLAGRDLTVEVATFEQWEPAGRRFDLAFSATAFHWIDPALRWTKSAEVLRPGGHLALATNRTVAGSTFDELHRAAEELHRRLDADMGDAGSPSQAELGAAVHSASSDIGVVWGVADPKSGTVPAGAVFERPVVRTYVFEQAYSADEAVLLLSTYSPYLAIPKERRTVLFTGLKEMIEQRFGGSVIRRYLSILAVSRRANTNR